MVHRSANRACVTPSHRRKKWPLSGLLLCVACAGKGEAPPPIVPPPIEHRATRPSGPIEARGVREVTADIGPRGGTLRLASGAFLEIPVAALSESTSITLSEAKHAKVFDFREGEKVIGVSLEAHPAIRALPDTYFTLSVPVGALPRDYTERDVVVAIEVADTQQRYLHFGALQTRWEYQTATFTAHRATAKLSELFGMRVQFLVAK